MLYSFLCLCFCWYGYLVYLDAVFGVWFWGIVGRYFVSFGLLLGVFSVFGRVVCVPPAVPSSFPLGCLRGVGGYVLVPWESVGSFGVCVWLDPGGREWEFWFVEADLVD